MEGLENNFLKLNVIEKLNIDQITKRIQGKQYIVCHISFPFSFYYNENWELRAYGPNGQVFIVDKNIHRTEKEKLVEEWINLDCPCCGSCAQY
jgi:hypothetical protein